MATFTYDTYANRPAAGTAGNIFFPTDGAAIYVDDGANWQAWGPMFPLTPVPTTGWSWVNQGNATVSTAYGGILIDDPVGGGAASSLNCYVRSATSPFTISLMHLGNYVQTNYPQYGFGFRDSSSGKLLVTQFQRYTSVIQFVRYTNATTVSAAVGTTHYPTEMGYLPKFFRMVDDGSDLYFQFSAEGVYWYTAYTEAIGAFLTPDQVCIWVNSYNSFSAVHVISWKEE